MPKIKGVCCNPFGKIGHGQFGTMLEATHTLVQRAQQKNLTLIINDLICNSCRLQLYKPSKDVTEQMNIDEGSTSHDLSESMDLDFGGESESENSNMCSEDSEIDEPEPIPDSEEIKKIKKITNELLSALGLSEIDNRKFRGKKYQTKLSADLHERLNEVLFTKADKDVANDKIIIKQLKKKFDDKDTNRNMKVKVLSVLPEEWSETKIKSIFGADVPSYLIRQTKILTAKNGILCDTTKKIGSKSVKESTVQKVINFYKSDHISRPCPGMRDFVGKYDEKGERQKIPRRLVLMNLLEAFELFKEEYPNDKIGFSKFAALRPIECVLAGSTHGIHTTCVCVYHQNVKLIFDSLKKSGMLDDKKTYRDVMNILLCKESKEECHLDKCAKCPGAYGESGLCETLRDELEANMIETVRYKQWVTIGCKFH